MNHQKRRPAEPSRQALKPECPDPEPRLTF